MTVINNKRGGIQMYKVYNLKKEYGQGDAKTFAVKDATLHVNKGETVFITGPSGSGKTTLLSMMGLLLTPTDGKMIFDNQNVESFNQKKLTSLRLRKLGFIFQNFKLINSFTILENVMVVLKIAGFPTKEAKERAAKILRSIGLGHRLNHYPEKISGGEKQRVAVARALVNDPELIMADEPTANLDYENGQLVCKIMQEIIQKQNKGLIVVTHDSRIQWMADRTYMMEDGFLKDVDQKNRASQASPMDQVRQATYLARLAHTGQPEETCFGMRKTG
jgi:ABC-type lipoprotein export system ATPase subunit